MTFTFRGLMAPVFTPFKPSGALDLEIIPEYATFLANSKIKGILVNGTSGEGTSLSLEERIQTAEAWMKAARTNKLHVMIQVGGAPMPDVIKLAHHAQSIGADSILCLPELYFKPIKIPQLINYLKIVGAAAPQTPLLYYHIPMFTSVNIHMGDFLNEIKNQIPTFAGIKFTSNALDEGIAALKADNGRYAVFLGADTLMAAAFALGFDSAIATTLNLVPHLADTILKAVQDSRLETARQYQDTLTAICNVITRGGGGWVPTMKAAMNFVTKLDVGKVRDPLTSLSDDEIARMKKDMPVTVDST